MVASLQAADMKFALVTLLAVAVAVAQATIDVERLTHVQPVMPVNPKLSWAEWVEVMSNQEVKADPEAVYPGTEPQPDDAGVAPYLPESRVISGSVASQGQIPWQAALTLDGSGFCGGSLISTTFVLTAAHCTAGISSFQVTLGASNIQTSQSGVVKQTSRNKIQHASYNANTLNNDIALIRITAVTQSNVVRAIRLPSQSQASNTFQGSTVTVSGFGRTSSTSGISSSLRYASLTVISNTNCATYFGSSINSYKICTTGANGRSPCNGDSGGPLFIADSDGQYTEVGLVSFGSNGCLATYPAVFTRITSYLSWISSNTGIAIRP